ncbi:hypothetical protein DRO66_05920 [Candidatus Bathyarchaeota archaeon]|nr:MAG: hypothetical protein DRO66_05920 [Candidatus Bathyarchaeota archaeon]
MSWNPKVELVKKAAEIAKDKHPSGFNKAQLIESSKEVYGGFGANPLKRIQTMEDVNNMGNYMAKIDGGYPVGMSGCYVVGLNGGCGLECPVFLEGECEEVGDLVGDLKERDDIDEDEKAKLISLYNGD